MPSRKFADYMGSNRRKRRTIALGDLSQKIDIQTRTLESNFSPNRDDTNVFTLYKQIWACVNTLNGSAIFDGINWRRHYTHEIFIRYRSDITEEHWVNYKNKRYDIVSVENLDERDDWLRILAIESGTDDDENEASHGFQRIR